MMLVAYMDRVDISVAGKAIMADLHITKTAFGFVLSAFTIGYALLQFPGGWLADKFGSKPLLVAALLMWSLFTGLTGMATSLAMLIAIRIVFGIGEGLENGAQFKLIGDHFEPLERSRANGIFLSALAVGPLLATPLATWLLGSVGWRVMF
jgi:MFS family permease